MTNRLVDHQSSRTVVLLGMGGSGKTQLALEFCRRAEKNLAFMAVVWIDALSPISVEQSFKVIAKQISKDRHEESNIESTVSFVQDILSAWNQKWLAVFDNYDNPRAFQSRGILSYLPTSDYGSILFTSRHADSARLGHLIEVFGMDENESLNLLLQRGPLDEEESTRGRGIAGSLCYHLSCPSTLLCSWTPPRSYKKIGAISLQSCTLRMFG